MRIPVNPSLTRRRLLALTGAGTVAASTFSVFGPLPASAADEYDVLRQRYKDLLVGVPDYDPADPDLRAAIDARDTATAALLAAVDTSPDRPGVFVGEVLRGATSSRPMQTTALNLASMAKSWATLGSDYYQSAELAATTVAGLQTLHDLLYHAEQREFDNWYHWEIGTARGVIEVVTVLYEQVSEQLRLDIAAAVEWFIPDPGFNYPPYHPGGQKPTNGSNRLEMCLHVAVGGILAKQAHRLQLATDTAPGAYPYVTDGSGFYRDGSYIYHDNVPYAGSYGRALVSAASVYFSIVGGSTWEIPQDGAAPLYDGVERAFRPWVVNAQTMPPVLGRSVSRANANSYWLMGSILMLAEGAPAAYKDSWRSIVRGWLERDTHDSFMTEREMVEVLLAKKLLSSDVVPVRETDGACVFPEMDRLTHRGPGWAIGLATASRRTRRYEAMSGENLKAWYHSAGTRYLYLQSEQLQFVSDWFPTVDYYRMPGTTVDSQPQADTLGGTPESAGWYDLTGGTSVGGSYAADGFYSGAPFASWIHHERSLRSTAEARMSWFAVPDGLVCLGAGITPGNGDPVESVIENRMVLQEQMKAWHVNGAPVPGAEEVGWEATIDDVAVLSLPGLASYLMLDGPRTVRLKHENRSGAWRDLNERSSTTVHTREFQTAWLDHGADPENASFGYLMAPLVSPRRGLAMAADPGVRVVENSPRVQAVLVPARGFAGAGFHAAGTVLFDGWSIGAEKHTSVSVLFGRGRGSAEIAVADPTHLRPAVTVTVELPRGRTWRVDSREATVDASVSGHTLTLTLDAAALDGRSHRLALSG